MVNKYLAAITLAMLTASPAAASTIYLHDSNGTLATVDSNSGTVNTIGDLGVVLTDIAFDPLGSLFGISFTDLYSVDATTAQTTLIGSHGISGGNGLVFGTDGTLYGAGSSTNLYSLNVGTGAGTSLGSTGFSSAGDLAFIGSDLFLSSTDGNLVSIDLSDLSASSAIGSFGVNDVFGLATDENSDLFGVAGTTVFDVDSGTATVSNVVSYSGQGLGVSFGSSFFAEAGADPADDPNGNVSEVPLPASAFFLIAALGGLAATKRRR